MTDNHLPPQELLTPTKIIHISEDEHANNETNQTRQTHPFPLLPQPIITGNVPKDNKVTQQKSPKSKKGKRQLTEIKGITRNKEAVVKFTDSTDYEVIDLIDMRLLYSKELLGFYESHFVIDMPPSQ